MVGFTSKRLLRRLFLGSTRSGTPCAPIRLSKSSARNGSRKAILASNKSSPPSRLACWFDLPKHSLLTEGNEDNKELHFLGIRILYSLLSPITILLSSLLFCCLPCHSCRRDPRF